MKTEKIRFGDITPIEADLSCLSENAVGRLQKYTIGNDGMLWISGTSGKENLIPVPEAGRKTLYDIEKIKKDGGLVFLRVEESGPRGLIEFIVFRKKGDVLRPRTATEGKIKIGINERIEGNGGKISPQDAKKEFILDEDGKQYVFVQVKSSEDESQCEDGELRLVGGEKIGTIREVDKDRWQLEKVQRIPRNGLASRVMAWQVDIDFVEGMAATSEALRAKYEVLVKERQSPELLALWKKYSELELEDERAQARQYVGFSLSYTRAEPCGGSRNQYRFFCDNLNETQWQEFKGCPLGFAVVSKEAVKTRNDRDGLINDRFQNYLADELYRDDNQNNSTVVCADVESGTEPPPDGYIVPSVVGTEKRNQRRRTAKEQIENERCSLTDLRYIIEEGLVGKAGLDRLSMIPEDELDRRVFDGKPYQLTELQKKAILDAVRSPDIYLIQGPPGTGKTSIIKGILAYLEFLQEKRQEQYSVLISSESHEAVDRAIEGTSYNGCFCMRLGGRFGKVNGTTDYAKWIAGVKERTAEFLRRNEGQNQYSNDIQAFRSALYDCLDVANNQPFAPEKIKGELIRLSAKISNLFPDWEDKQEELDRLCRQLDEFSVDSEGRDALEELRTCLEAQSLDPQRFDAEGREPFEILLDFVCAPKNKRRIPSIKNLRMNYWYDINYDIVGVDDPGFEDSLRVIREDTDMLQKECARVDPTAELQEELESTVRSMQEILQARHLNSNGKKMRALENFLDHIDDDASAKSFLEQYVNYSAATCQQSGKNWLAYGELSLENPKSYDYVIVDEAAKANPLDLMIPMSMGKHIIMIGDHRQLPHLVDRKLARQLNEESNSYKSDEADEPNADASEEDHAKEKQQSNEEMLQQSLFALIYSKLDNNASGRTTLLQEQFRMNRAIGDLVSEEFYDGQLLSPKSADDIVHHIERYHGKPIVWIDVPHAEAKDCEQQKNSSYTREAEVQRVMRETEEILKATDESFTVGIISFYSAQVERLKEAMEQMRTAEDANGEKYDKYANRTIKIGSVDAFQGQEFDAVILSSVRSNDWKTGSEVFRKNKHILTENEAFRKSIGFLSAMQRQNVAFSRAKRLLILVGDRETLLRFKVEERVKMNAEKENCSMHAFRTLWERSWKFDED